MKNNISAKFENPVKREEFLSLQPYKHKDITCNWSNTNVLAFNRQIKYPNTEEEIQDIVTYHTGKIRVVGSRLSYEPIASVVKEGSNAILISLEKLQGYVSMTEDSVTFRAGSTLNSLNQFLIENNRMLPASPGVIGIQTLAGAISTGTHGQGLGQSTLSDTVLMLRIVLPDGSIEEIDSSHEDFGAFIMSLGCLGVITQITFRTVPNQIFTCRKITTNYSDLVKLYPVMNRRSKFVKAWWFSWTDEVHMWEVNEASHQEIDQYFENNQELTSVSSRVDESLNDTINNTMIKMSHDTNDTTFKGKHFETVTRFKNATNVTGNVYQILCKGIPAPQINCEIAIPFEKIGEALEMLKHWQNNNQSSLHYPFILRCTGPSKAYLSPAYGRDVCFIGFLVYLASDGSFIEGSMEKMKEIQEELAKLGGIPHFGKHFVKELYNLRKLLPRWDDFIRVKTRLDPKGKFENDFIRELFI